MLFAGAKQERVNMATKPGQQLGYFTCIFCKEIFEGDKRRLCCDNPECQEKQHERIKKRAKQRAKRNGQKKRTNNPCIICGIDKGVNRFYCKICHSKLSKVYGFEEFSTDTHT